MLAFLVLYGAGALATLIMTTIAVGGEEGFFSPRGVLATLTIAVTWPKLLVTYLGQK